MQQKKRARVLIVDDDPIARAVIGARLAGQKRYELLEPLRDGSALDAALQASVPNVILLDMLMPNTNGLTALRRLASRSTNICVIMVSSALSRRELRMALELGVRGAVLKERLEELPGAIDAVISGHYWIHGKNVFNLVPVLQELSDAQDAAPEQTAFGLTPRELQIVGLIAEGCGNKDIAAHLHIAEETVKRHLTKIFDKVGMSTRLELALFAIHHGIAKASL